MPVHITEAANKIVRTTRQIFQFIYNFRPRDSSTRTFSVIIFGTLSHHATNFFCSSILHAGSLQLTAGREVNSIFVNVYPLGARLLEPLILSGMARLRRQSPLTHHWHEEQEKR